MLACRPPKRRMGSIAYAAIMALGVQSNCTPAVAQSTTQTPPSATPIAQYVAEAAQRYSLPEAWIYAVMRVESAGDIDATSAKGAIGLMQVMPGTYAELRMRHGLGPNPYDPRDNIMAGAAYLREMYNRYGAPGFLAAYNAGPGRYEDYLAGRMLPAETRGYLARLAPHVDGGAAVQPALLPDPLAWTRARLFARNWAAAERAVEPAMPQPPPSASAPIETLAEAPVNRPLGSLFIPLSGQRP